jgi:hypothetical protein
MTREIVASHDPDTLTPDFAAALVVHRAAPGVSITKLCQRAKHPGPARRAVEHARDCPVCGVAALCPTGARLAAKLGRRRRRRRAA